jgi:hypothetical protein
LDTVTAELVEPVRVLDEIHCWRLGGRTPELLAESNAAKHMPGLGVRSVEPVLPSPAREVPPSPDGAESPA